MRIDQSHRRQHILLSSPKCQKVNFSFWFGTNRQFCVWDVRYCDTAEDVEACKII